MYSLEKLYLYPSWKCNLQCKHCWVSSGPKYSEILELEYVNKAISEAVEFGLKLIKLSGGEPTLLLDYINTVTELCRKHQVALSIETNGTLITEKIAEAISRANSYVNVSLDSFTEKNHNSFRCSDVAYKDTLKGIKILQKHSIPVGITYSITHYCEAEIDSMIQLLSYEGITDLKINPILRVGRAQDEIIQFPYTLNTTDFEKLVQNYHGKSKNNVVIKTMVPPCFLPPTDIISGKKLPIVCNYLTQLSVLPDGTVGLCGEAKDIKAFQFGNIKKQALRDIWENSHVLNLLRNDIPNNIVGVCGFCKYKNNCLGGCRVAAFIDSKSHNGSNPYALDYYSMHGKLPYHQVNRNNASNSQNL